MSATGTAKIEKMIRAAVSNGLDGILAERRPAIEAALKSGPARVAVNSSFILRKKPRIPTNQSDRRLLLGLRSVEDFDIAVADGMAMTSPAKLLSAGDQPPTTALRDAIGAELGRIGDLIFFALLGKVVGLRPATAAVKGGRVTEIQLRGGAGEIKLAAPGIISVSGIRDVGQVLDRIGDALGSPLTDDERQSVGKAYTELVDGAITATSPPDGDPAGSVLGGIVRAMRAKADEYDRALTNLEAEPESSQALHEVLRLAYNFSTDILPLIALFVGVCDLNPILFWCTLDRQWDIESRLKRLPWGALGRKGDLDDYEQVISAARSHAFHHILPFEGTLEVDLAGADVRAERVRLFPLAKSKDGGVRLREQDLADLLAKFARGVHRPVGLTFWRGNAEVMRAAASLGEAMLAALAAVYAASRG